MTVNITCRDCDGRRLCERCRAAASRFERAGYHVEHSTRYAALKAAATGTYGFDACVVPIGPAEGALADAARVLFAGKHVALVTEDGLRLDSASSGRPDVHVIDAKAFSAGEFSVDWLDAKTAGGPATASRLLDREPRTDKSPGESLSSDQTHATRRLKRVADAARITVATADLPAAPRLDLVAVLEDEIAWARASGATFSIVLVHLPGVSAVRAGEDISRREERLAAAERAIASALRSTDIVAVGGEDFLAALADAGEDGARLAVARIARAVSASGLRSSRSKRPRGFGAWSAGYATYPGDGASRDTVLARATARLEPLEGLVG